MHSNLSLSSSPPPPPPCIWSSANGCSNFCCIGIANLIQRSCLKASYSYLYPIFPNMHQSKICCTRTADRQVVLLGAHLLSPFFKESIFTKELLFLYTSITMGENRAFEKFQKLVIFFPIKCIFTKKVKLFFIMSLVEC